MVLRGDEDNYRQSAPVQLSARPQHGGRRRASPPQLTERFWVIPGRPGTRIVGVGRTLVAGQYWSGGQGCPRLGLRGRPGSR